AGNSQWSLLGGYRVVTGESTSVALHVDLLPGTAGEATGLLQSHLLGTDHVLPGWGQAQATAVHPDSGRVERGFVAIVATQDGTQVTVVPASGTVASLQPPAIPSVPAGQPLTFQMQRNQAVHVHAIGSLAGSTVRSDKPVAVFAGVACDLGTGGTQPCPTAFEAVPPLRPGRDYVACRATPALEEVLEIVPASGAVVASFSDGTIVTIQPPRTEVPLTQDTFFTLSGPALVAHQVRLPSLAGFTPTLTDGSFTVLLPVNAWEWARANTFPPVYASSFTVGARATTSLTLDGTPVAPLTPIAGTPYGCARLAVLPGYHELAGTQRFQAHAVGSFALDVYQHALPGLGSSPCMGGGTDILSCVPTACLDAAQLATTAPDPVQAAAGCVPAIPCANDGSLQVGPRPSTCAALPCEPLPESAGCRDELCRQAALLCGAGCVTYRFDRTFQQRSEAQTSCVDPCAGGTTLGAWVDVRPTSPPTADAGQAIRPGDCDIACVGSAFPEVVAEEERWTARHDRGSVTADADARSIAYDAQTHAACTPELPCQPPSAAAAWRGGEADTTYGETAFSSGRATAPPPLPREGEAVVPAGDCAPRVCDYDRAGLAWRRRGATASWGDDERADADASRLRDPAWSAGYDECYPDCRLGWQPHMEMRGDRRGVSYDRWHTYTAPGPPPPWFSPYEDADQGAVDMSDPLDPKSSGSYKPCPVPCMDQELEWEYDGRRAHVDHGNWPTDDESYVTADARDPNDPRVTFSESTCGVCYPWHRFDGEAGRDGLDYGQREWTYYPPGSYGWRDVGAGTVDVSDPSRPGSDGRLDTSCLSNTCTKETQEWYAWDGRAWARSAAEDGSDATWADADARDPSNPWADHHVRHPDCAPKPECVDSLENSGRLEDRRERLTWRRGSATADAYDPTDPRLDLEAQYGHCSPVSCVSPNLIVGADRRTVEARTYDDHAAADLSDPQRPYGDWDVSTPACASPPCANLPHTWGWADPYNLQANENDEYVVWDANQPWDP
ncbi:MAG TPA: IgGFc-binding protein, partial [Candidatus Thermoplasmatota archaeon]|nr:IgGFc-binding protein [Candidatus Thermoplasmatota archaeon]